MGKGKGKGGKKRETRAMILETGRVKTDKVSYRETGRLNIRHRTSFNRFHLVQLLVLLDPTSSLTLYTSLHRLDYRPTPPRMELVPCFTGQRQNRTLKKLSMRTSKSIRNGSKLNRRLKGCGNSGLTYSSRVVEKVLYHLQSNGGSF